MMDFLYAILGLVILVLAGDVLVRGAVNSSLRLGVPALIVSLTVVAVGTSAPELLVAVQAVLEDAPGIALGNVVGSNIANVLLVLGIPALLAGLNTGACDSRDSYLQMIFGTVLFMVFAFMAPMNWLHGLALLILYAGVMAHAVMVGSRHKKANDLKLLEAEIDEVDPHMPWWKIFLYLALGLVGLPMGADMLVEGATNIARDYRISETVIGLTLVAVGTSLPELATTIAAAFRRQADVALGNVIGSNMANSLGIIGVAALFGDIPVTNGLLSFDIWVMLGAAVLLAPFVLTRMNMGRLWGGLFTGLYVAYVVIVLM